MAWRPAGEGWRTTGTAEHSRAWHSINERPAPQFPPDRPDRIKPYVSRENLATCFVHKDAPLYPSLYQQAGVNNTREYRLTDNGIWVSWLWVAGRMRARTMR
jgi:hypothetical protein